MNRVGSGAAGRRLLNSERFFTVKHCDQTVRRNERRKDLQAAVRPVGHVLGTKGGGTRTNRESLRRLVSHEFLVPVNSSAASSPPPRADSPQRRDGDKMSLMGGEWVGGGDVGHKCEKQQLQFLV